MSPPADPPANSARSLPDDDAPWISDGRIADEKLADEQRSDKPAAENSAALSSRGGGPASAPTAPPKKHSAQLFPVTPSGPKTAPASDSLEHLSPSRFSPTQGINSRHTSPMVGPLPLVETAFLASAASLMWLVNAYFPPGPLLRILFPLPIALVYLRWNLRAAWMGAIVSGLLLTILLGPTRSIFFVMPYGFLGVQLGCLWRRKARWEISIFTGALLVALGSFFRIWLLSLLAGEDLWGYLVAQMTQLIDWGLRLLTNWGWLGLGVVGQPSIEFVAIAAVLMVVFASTVYLFTVHLAAWLLLERLGITMPPPPNWVQTLIEE